jgi:hypothetical protein
LHHAIKRDQDKQELIEQFGSGCQKCSYHKSLRALQFHHIDSTEKRDWTTLAEVRAHPERFQLLCANCHFETHEQMDQQKRVYLTCQTCGKSFRRPQNWQLPGRGKYCSRACQKPGMRAAALASVTQRIWKHIQIDGECWLWTGYTVGGRTPVIQSLNQEGEHRAQPVIRVLIEQIEGSPPAEKRVKMTCGRSHCVNPAHSNHQFSIL